MSLIFSVMSRRFSRFLRSRLTQQRLLCSQINAARYMGTCAVIGGNGFLGSHIARQLADKGHSVRVLDMDDKLNQTIYELPHHQNIEYEKCDITNLHNVYRSLRNVNTIFHCASVIDIRMYPSAALHNVNVNGTKNIIKFCNDKSTADNVASRLIYTSTMEVFNVHGTKTFVDAKESVPVYGKEYFNGYPRTKSLAEQTVIHNKMINTDLKVSAIRLGAIYGPHNEIHRVQLETYEKNGAIIIGDGATISACYVENAADAHIQLAEKIDTHDIDIDGEVFNYKDSDMDVGKFWYTQIMEHPDKKFKRIPTAVAMCIAILTEIQVVLHRAVYRREPANIFSFNVLSVKMSTAEHTINADKYNQVIGYNPPVSFDESVERTKQWVRSLR